MSKSDTEFRGIAISAMLIAVIVVEVSTILRKDWGHYTIMSLENMTWWIGLLLNLAAMFVTAKLIGLTRKSLLPLSLGVLVVFHAASLAWFPLITHSGEYEKLNTYATQAVFVPEHWDHYEYTYSCGEDGEMTCVSEGDNFIPEQNYFTIPLQGNPTFPQTARIEHAGFQEAMETWGTKLESRRNGDSSPLNGWVHDQFGNRYNQEKKYWVNYPGNPESGDFNGIIPVTVDHFDTNWLKPSYNSFGKMADADVPPEAGYFHTTEGTIRLQRVFDVKVNNSSFVSEVQSLLDRELVVLGSERQVNPIVLFVNADKVSRSSFVTDLEIAWKGGHKNDLITVIGVTTELRTKWVSVISNNDQSGFDLELEAALIQEGVLTPESFVNALVKQVRDPIHGYIRTPMASVVDSVFLKLPLLGVLAILLTAVLYQALMVKLVLSE